MKRGENKIIVSLMMILFVFQTHAQEDVVTGTITAFNSMAIENVEVHSKKGDISVFTDSLGKFTIARIKKDKLSIKAAGFKSQSVKVGDVSESITVNLVFGGSEKDMEVAVGGGYMSKEDLTVAIDQYNEAKNSNSAYANVIELMKAKYAQIQINAGKKEIKVRSNNSMSPHSNTGALILVNEFAVGYDYLLGLPATDVKSISVLKGSAASVYGSRGANGVVIVTLKNNLD